MIIQQGMLYYDKMDILQSMFWTEASIDLEKKEKESSILPRIPDALKWTFISNHNYINLPFDFTLIAVPCEVVEQITLRITYESMLQNPILSHEKKDYFESLISGQESEMDKLAVEYTNGFKKLINEACFIWYYTNENLLAVFAESPSNLLTKGPLNTNIRYTCVNCKHSEIAKNDIPDMYYNENNDMYCPKCATSKMKHVGE